MKLLRHRFTFYAMGGSNEVQMYVAGRDQAQEVAQKVVAEVRRIESKYSRYQEGSIICQINRAAGETPTPLDGETATLLRYADACFKQSSGLFDITSGVLRKVWNFKENLLPTNADLKPLLAKIGWGRVNWDDHTILLPEKGMEIDFGGIGKEYAVDRAIGVLSELGVTSCLVNFAGDLRASAPQPDGSPWRVGLSHPRIADAVSGVIELSRGAVATSGDYERFITVNGRRYCHILNPRTGWPVCGVQSVTVVADACLLAGSAATTAMLLGARSLSYLRKLGLAHYMIDQQSTRHVENRGVQGECRFLLHKRDHIHRLTPLHDSENISATFASEERI